MRMVDVIARKRDGHSLSQAEIDFFVAGATDGSVPDYQAAALLMAIVLQGMTGEETSWLTDAMVRSGARVDLSDVPGRKVGKHSTGGVGDKVSIVLAPLAAACGVIVPKMSGRGLGHTGGTLDKLESIPGYRIDLSLAEFKDVLRRVGASIVGQTAALAPADKKLYALRDVTATVESIPLIAASIMSKKLAEGADALILDVKCGDGAFMKTLDRARALAEAMVAIGGHAGVRTEAMLTDMNAPLGCAVGNALEIAECVDTLAGRGPADLVAVACRFAARMVELAGIDTDPVAARARVDRALASGHALERLARMIAAHGGDARITEDTSRLPSTSGRAHVLAPRAGFVRALGAEAVGRASHALGAGRDKLGDAVDHAVGVVVRAHPGDRVEAGQPVVELHHRDGRGVDEAVRLIASALVVGDEAPTLGPKVLGEVR